MLGEHCTEICKYTHLGKTSKKACMKWLALIFSHKISIPHSISTYILSLEYSLPCKHVYTFLWNCLKSSSLLYLSCVHQIITLSTYDLKIFYTQLMVFPLFIIFLSQCIYFCFYLCHCTVKHQRWMYALVKSAIWKVICCLHVCPLASESGKR